MGRNILFCPKCGAILKAERVDRKVRFTCSCGFSEDEKSSKNIQVKELIRESSSKKGEGVIDESENKLAVYDHKCKKCGYGKAQLIERGIQYSDEDDMTFYKCGKCGYMEMIEAKVK